MTDGAHAIIYMGMCAVSSRKQRQSQLITIGPPAGAEHVRKEIRLFMIYKRLKACGQSLMIQRMYCQHLDRCCSDLLPLLCRTCPWWWRRRRSGNRGSSTSGLKELHATLHPSRTRGPNIKTAAAATLTVDPSHEWSHLTKVCTRHVVPTRSTRWCVDHSSLLLSEQPFERVHSSTCDRSNVRRCPRAGLVHSTHIQPYSRVCVKIRVLQRSCRRCGKCGV